MKPNILRPYQEQAGQAWHAFVDRGGQRGLIVAATGTGKNTIISKIVEDHSKVDAGFASLILAHQRELLEQTMATIGRQAPWLSCGLELGSDKCRQGTRVALGSVQSLGALGCTRLDWLAPGLVVVDEGHHGAARTYQNVFRRMGCYDDPGTYLLGVTATPHRLDQLALYGDRGIFQEIVFVYSIVQAIKQGFLVDLRGYRAMADFDLSKVKIRNGDYDAKQLERTMNTDPVNELAFTSWSDVARDRQTIVFCTGVDHAKDLAHLYREHGVAAEAVYGEMAPALREATLKRFHTGETQVLTNMSLLTEGFDAVKCSCVVQLRPTQPWSLFTQMVGRGLRVIPSVIAGIGDNSERREAVKNSAKPDCIVIDIVENTELHGVGEAPESKDIPSLQGLVGLPSALDMEGKTLAEAVETWDDLSPFAKAAAFRRKTSFSGLSAMLTQVEMLKELEMPDELNDSGARLQWLKTGDLTYALDLGVEIGGGLLRRRASLRGDLLGRWSLHYVCHEGSRIVREDVTPLPGETLREATLQAEEEIRRKVPGVMRTAARDAHWRQGSPTDTQVRQLKELGLDSGVVAGMSRGVASQMLSRIQELGLEIVHGGG